MAVQRIVRDRYLTDEEAAKYAAIRARVEPLMPEIIAEHMEWLAKRPPLCVVGMQCRSSRESHALTVSAEAAAAGCDPAEAEAIENGTGNPTLETLRNYARAVGKRLVIRLADPEEPAETVATGKVSG